MKLFLEIFFFNLLIFPVASYAYLDPGTGSMLLSVFVGFSSAAYFGLRRLPSLLRAAAYKLTGQKDRVDKASIVFYSESKNYWPTFKPIISELVKDNVDIVYLTSDEDEEIFTNPSFRNVKARFIGKGNKAFFKLNFLECDILVLTTPGVDVLQIKRSRGVKNYVHIVHSLSDIHGYKLYSFDYYDTILVSGSSQEESLRHLEKTRGTIRKEIVRLGCPYLDNLVSRANEAKFTDKNILLLAPTWGKNSFLYKYSPELLRILSARGYKLIFRPHPQSLISDKEILRNWLKVLNEIEGAEYDNMPDGFDSLSRSSIMLSDLSGVVFDFSFVFKRPVVTIGGNFVKEGFEAWDLPKNAWELSSYDLIGKRIISTSSNSSEEICEVLETVKSSFKQKEAEINTLISQEAINLGHASKGIAAFLVNKSCKLQKQSKKNQPVTSSSIYQVFCNLKHKKKGMDL